MNFLALALVPLLGFTWWLQRRFDRSSESSLFFATGLLVSTLYLAGLLGLLRPAAHGLFAVGFVLFLAIPFSEARRDRARLAALLSPGIVVFVVFSVAHAWTFADEALLRYDEFSQWGIAGKELIAHDRLPASGDNASARYPPGAALWLYFVTRNVGFSEGGMLFANALLLVAPMQILFQGISWRQPFLIVLVIAIQGYLLASFSLGIVDLRVDPILAIVAGAAVLLRLSEKEDDRGRWLLAFPLVSLVLVKEFGLILALAVVGFAWIDHFSIRRPAGRSLRALVRDVGPLLAATVLAAFVWTVRSTNRGATNIIQRLATTVRSPALVDPADAARPAAPAAEAPATDVLLDPSLVIERFWEALMRLPVARSEEFFLWNEFTWPLWERLEWSTVLSASAFLAIAFSMVALRWSLARRERARLAGCAVWMVGFFAMNAVAVLLIYLFVIPDWRAPQLPSYLRYINVGVFAVMFLAFGVHLPVCGGFGTRKRFESAGSIVSAVPAFVLAALLAVERPVVTDFYSPRFVVPLRSTLAAGLEAVRAEVPPDGRLLVVHAREDQPLFFQVVIRYELAPILVRFGPRDFGHHPREAVDRKLRGFDYVWFVAPSRQTVHEALIPMVRRSPFGLMRIDSDEGGVRIQPVR